MTARVMGGDLWADCSGLWWSAGLSASGMKVDACRQQFSSRNCKSEGAKTASAFVAWEQNQSRRCKQLCLMLEHAKDV